MSDLAIRVENLSKHYQIGARQEVYHTLRDTLTEAVARPFQKLCSFFSRNGADSVTPEASSIWALKDVSFEVKRGEVVGIIGRNGAGKSTLLKILSRITEPTEGRIKIHGRVGSLLEVGTGFHNELTGRENTYLNGAILGMKKAEIDRKFDEIVGFSGIEQFIDTPVKHYSSGMYVRLAFAVAAHLEPEILIVDEVLAVGDAEFQKKCLGKMETVAKEGRTVLFVSHNMPAIQRLCTAAILLESGRIRSSGTPQSVTEMYLEGGGTTSLHWERSSLPITDVYLTRVSVSDRGGNPRTFVSTATPVAVVIDFVVGGQYHGLQLSVGLLDGHGCQIFGSSPQDGGALLPNNIGQYRAIVYFPAEILMPKTYGIRVALWLPHGGVLDSVDSLRFSVEEAASLVNSTPGGRLGLLALRCHWNLERLNPHA